MLARAEARGFRSAIERRAAALLLLALCARPAHAQAPDFETYRTRVEPIFLKPRAANGPGGSCFLCHTHVNSRLRLQPLSPGQTAWSEEQSRRNFEAVRRLVTPGDPLESPLLLRPLAATAGGAPIHAGGKHWQSRDDPEWQTLAAWVRTASAAEGVAVATGAPLDFEVFKTRVQPIFAAKRAGLARCHTCHSQTTNFRLQRLPKGAMAWDEHASRLNFEAVQRLVVPGDPRSSRLLMQPLAAAAGGDPFHPGGKHWASQEDPEWQTLASWVQGARPRPQRVVIVQTNAAGDNVHLIDPAANKVVGEITGIEVNHGVAAAPDGSRLYFTNEAAHSLDVVDGRTLAVTHGIPLSGRPNNVAIGRDGRRVYVAIRSDPGAVDVIDTPSLARVKTIPVRGGVHNTFTTPDGRYVVAGSIPGRNLTVIDARSEDVSWSLDFDGGVRPIAFETKPDGSTHRLFVQISDFHGFYVVDFDARKEVARVTLPELPPHERHLDMLQGSPAHGIGVTPDGRTLWVCSKVNGHVYAYSLPALKLLGGVRVGEHPDWLTFTPDSKTVYVANAGSNSVSAVDVASLREVARIAVGQVPKRNITARLP
jgi:YVTN family beta-propeller protein